MAPQFGDYQYQIQFDGLRGVLPELPMAFAELERRAQAALPASLWSYVAGGAGDEATQRANVRAFEQWGLMPRMLVGATERDLTVELFGHALPSPLFMAPVGALSRVLDTAGRVERFERRYGKAAGRRDGAEQQAQGPAQAKAQES